MGESLGNAFAIMIVGMLTVFFILWLVVLIGNVLIRITNKFWPESEVIKKTIQSTEKSSSNTIAAIVAAVDIVTKGKGKITKITKV